MTTEADTIQNDMLTEAKHIWFKLEEMERIYGVTLWEPSDQLKQYNTLCDDYWKLRKQLSWQYLRDLIMLENGDY